VQALDLMRDRSLGFRAMAAIVLAIICAALQAVIVEQVVVLMFPPDPKPSPYLLAYASDFFPRLWVFACFGGVSVALSYVADIRDREERIGSLRALAHSAQLRALRNQLSPHFLFNALNSVAGLISARRVDEAEAMTVNLADFLRQTLELDPQKLITLDEELQLQGLYLDIEKARFPDRLSVVVDVPAELRSALVPSLITQPLVENSIKYAVARSTCEVELCIAATRRGDDLQLTVKNTGGDIGNTPSKGARFGLRNVDERIHMHYGDRAQFHSGPDANGGYRNTVIMPLETQS
jgi:LytS/YehU family sensor histidine kinase